MKLLVADDDPVYGRLLQRLLRDDYEVVIAYNGQEAWEILQLEDGPCLAVLNWVMPGLDGPEVCRKLRADPDAASKYVVLATGRQGVADIVAGLQAGADDYVVKPFHTAELKARLQVGQRVLELQAALRRRIEDLRQALAKVNQLRGLLPICAYCKKIRDDHDYWQQLETYLSQHSEALFSHSICPDCYERNIKPEVSRAAEVEERHVR